MTTDNKDSTPFLVCILPAKHAESRSLKKAKRNKKLGVIAASV